MISISIAIAFIFICIASSLPNAAQLHTPELQRRAEPGVPICESFDFTIPVQASNDSGVLLPAATYQISSYYCPPTVYVPERSRTVQVLIHGATATKYYWSALGPVGGGYEETHYSWIDFARSQGYHTIAIDRLGVGNSSHPNPLDVRLPLDADITSKIVYQLRTKPLQIPYFQEVQESTSFDRVVLVGHSIASVILNYLIIHDPEVADAVILTGYVHIFTEANSSGQEFAPASSVFPQRFAGLDPGYQTIVSAQNMRQSFFSANGTFDPLIPTINWEREDVQATGEVQSLVSLLTSSFATAPAGNFTAPIALVIGQNDEVLCESDCGSGEENLAVMSKSYFPDSKAFEPIVIPNTGHFLNLHYSARDTFIRVHEWLESVGL